MNTREILTLQFGNYANYVGTHWWNIQESTFNYDPTAEPSEIDHDVLYRNGVDYKGGVTFTPRLLLVDLQGALCHLPEEGSLYEEISIPVGRSDLKHKVEKVKECVPWEQSAIEVIQKIPVKKPEFQEDIANPNVDIENKEYNFAESVETWTDFLYTRFHHRTVNIIKQYELSKEGETFDSISNGMRMWETEEFETDFTDKIRQYVEECNSAQGFQTIFDCHNAFSGLALKCLEHLNDEYSKSNFAIPVFSPKDLLFESSDGPMTDSIRTVNIALSYSHLIEKSSLFLPLSVLDRAWRKLGSARHFPLVKYNEQNLYHTSAILASFLDTITLRYRLKDCSSNSYLPGFCSDLNTIGRKLVAGAFSFPFPMRSDHDLIDCLDKFEGNLFTQLSPNSQIGTDYLIQSACVRGIPRSRLKRPLMSAQHQMKMAAYKCESVSEMFQLYFQCENHASLAHVSALQTPLFTKKPYPLEMFDTRLNCQGFIRDFERPEEQKIRSLPTVASVQSSGDLANTIESLHREAKKVKIAKLHRFKETGLESDEYVEALESLLQFKDYYEDNIQL